MFDGYPRRRALRYYWPCTPRAESRLSGPDAVCSRRGDLTNPTDAEVIMAFSFSFSSQGAWRGWRIDLPFSFAIHYLPTYPRTILHALTRLFRNELAPGGKLLWRKIDSKR